MVNITTLTSQELISELTALKVNGLLHEPYFSDMNTLIRNELMLRYMGNIPHLADLCLRQENVHMQAMLKEVAS